MEILIKPLASATLTMPSILSGGGFLLALLTCAKAEVPPVLARSMSFAISLNCTSNRSLVDLKVCASILCLISSLRVSSNFLDISLLRITSALRISLIWAFCSCLRLDSATAVCSTISFSFSFLDASLYFLSKSSFTLLKSSTSALSLAISTSFSLPEEALSS